MFEKIYKSGKTIQVLANHDQKERREITYATKKTSQVSMSQNSQSTQKQIKLRVLLTIITY